jgi:hypothetical protein
MGLIGLILPPHSGHLTKFFIATPIIAEGGKNFVSGKQKSAIFAFFLPLISKQTPMDALAPAFSSLLPSRSA